MPFSASFSAPFESAAQLVDHLGREGFHVRSRHEPDGSSDPGDHEHCDTEYDEQDAEAPGPSGGGAA